MILDRLLRAWKARHLLQQAKQNSKANQQSQPISLTLDKNIKAIRGIMNQSVDLTIRRFHIGNKPGREAALFFLEGLANKDRVTKGILEPLLLDDASPERFNVRRPDEVLMQIKNILTSAELAAEQSLEQAVNKMLRGHTILLIDGLAQAVILSTEGWDKRNIASPETEVSIRGSREGFTETIVTSVAQLRRQLPNPDLVFERMELGRLSKTQVCVAYIKGVSNPKVISEVYRRLRRIDMDAIEDVGYIEDLIRDQPFSIFPTIATSERPDRVAAKLVEGRVAIIVDGSPMVATVPTLFIEHFQYPDDYFYLPHFGTLIRWVRYISFAVSVLAPAVFIAVTSFHQELLPTRLLFTMAAAREGTPFPVLFEALLMGLTFEMLQEAGTRLPRPVGQTVSIVGALVIGDAAVRSGLIGAPMVMVIAITAIASFVIPSLTEVLAPMRLFLAVLSGVIGAFGIVLGILIILVHLASLRSFGIPYLSPLAPLTPADLKDTVVRVPWWAMHKRPRVIGWANPVREDTHMRPGDNQPKRGKRDGDQR